MVTVRSQGETGRRTLFPIPLKIRTSLTAIGGAISGHPTELYGRCDLRRASGGPRAKAPSYCCKMNFPHRDTRVTTFCTYPEPRPIKGKGKQFVAVRLGWQRKDLPEIKKSSAS